MSNEGRVVGPIGHDEVHRGIADGAVRAGFMVRDEASPGWVPVEQSPFGPLLPPPAVIAATAPAVRSKKSGAGGLAQVVGILLGVLVLFVFAARCANSRKEPDAVVAPVAAQPAPPPEPTIQQALMEAKSLDGAIRLLRPHMGDTRGEDLPGAAAMLAIWMNIKLQWLELEAMPDSRRVDAMKDPEAFRGRRICTSGTVIEIHADHSVSPPLYQGGLMTSSYDMVRFIAAKSTSQIVADEAARFCGIITGLQSYANVSGGTTHALFVVGVFDLPENH